MNVLNETTEYNIIDRATQILDNENDNINITLKLLLLSIPCGVLLLSLIGLIIPTMFKPLFS